MLDYLKEVCEHMNWFGLVKTKIELESGIKYAIIY